MSLENQLDNSIEFTRVTTFNPDCVVIVHSEIRDEMYASREVIIRAILGCAIASSLETESTVDANFGTDKPSALLPQVGYLENRPDISVATGKNDAPPNNENSGNKGILVPVVSVVDASHDAPKSLPAGNPLVALLPAPPAAINPDQHLGPIATLPIVPVNDRTQPEIERSPRDTGAADSSSEIMDFAEDIVFRPLFRIRPGYNGAYSQTGGNYGRRRDHRLPDYRRYNVNGYYRLPYDYFRNNDNGDYSRRRRRSSEINVANGYTMRERLN